MFLKDDTELHLKTLIRGLIKIKKITLCCCCLFDEVFVPSYPNLGKLPKKHRVTADMHKAEQCGLSLTSMLGIKLPVCFVTYDTMAFFFLRPDVNCVSVDTSQFLCKSSALGSALRSEFLVQPAYSEFYASLLKALCKAPQTGLDRVPWKLSHFKMMCTTDFSVAF